MSRSLMRLFAAYLCVPVVFASGAPPESDPDALFFAATSTTRLPMRNDLMRMPTVRERLSVTADQVLGLKEVSDFEVSEFRLAQRRAKRIPAGSDGLSTSQRIALLSRASRLDCDKKVGDILTKTQTKELDELVLQSQIGSIGIVGVLSNEWSASPVHLSAEESKDLRVRAQQIQNALERKIAALKKEAVEELLKEVPPAKASALVNAMGKDAGYWPSKVTK